MQTPRSNGALVNLATLILAVVALYFGKPVLMPLAVATLLAFLLAPVVKIVARSRIGQSAAVWLVVLLMFSIFGAVIWGFGAQLRSLAYELPDYKQNVQAKIADLRTASKGPALDRIRQTWREMRGELRKAPTANSADTNQSAVINTNVPAAEREPVPVVLQGHGGTNIWAIPTALGPLIEVLGTAALILVLVIFMLIRKRELRNRLILLFGYGQIPTTTRALDEAGERISRYLLMQTIVNSTFGLAVGVSLYFVGLPYALLWGLLAALLRFIPYVGPWLGAIMPILLSLAVFPGWLHAFLILGLILVFELISNMFMEPRLYGQSAGVSEVALLVAVAFWTWIWGPIGLALATPLTVCIVVLGKYVPGLSFLVLLMGDEAVMEPPMEFYQRLLAMDDVEVAEIARAYRKDHELIDVYDELFLPALVSARRDYGSDKLSTDHLDFIINTTGQLITKLGHNERAKGIPADGEVREPEEVLAVPVEDTIDELVMCMLAHVVPAFVSLRTVSTEALSGEILEQASERAPRLICIGSIVPGGLKETRYLVKRFRLTLPKIPLIVVRWGLRNEKKERELARMLETELVTTNLKSARNYIVQMLQLSPERAVTVELGGRAPVLAAARAN